MEDTEKAMIPYFVHESVISRAERQHKRILIALIISIILVFASNALWLYAWMQYDYSGEEITVDSNDGIANYIGGSGGIINGTGGSQEKQKD